MTGPDLDHAPPDAPDPGFQILSLLTAIVLALLLTIYPHVAMDRWGQADHPTALLLLWSMCAGFVRGVGFIPRHWAPRLLLSSGACLTALVLALPLIARH